MLSSDLDLLAEPPAKPSVQTLAQAAEWYATLRDNSATEQDRQAWRSWLVQSPEHAQAWQHIENVSRKFDPLRAAGPQGAAAAVNGTQTARRMRLSRRRAFGGLASVLGLGLAGWLGWRHTTLPDRMMALAADHHTGIGERRELMLADGSRVWLNTSTALDVADEPGMRRLVLHAGEILVETAPDQRHRPFYVGTRFGRLQALGTRFTVRQYDTQTRLDVFEGTVRIRTAAGQVRLVKASQAALFDANLATTAGASDHLREAWRRGRIPADNLRLGDLLAELSRYRPGHISVAPEVAYLKVMGVYPADQPDLALSMLEQTLPIRVRRSLPWWITVAGR